MSFFGLGRSSITVVAVRSVGLSAASSANRKTRPTSGSYQARLRGGDLVAAAAEPDRVEVEAGLGLVALLGGHLLGLLEREVELLGELLRLCLRRTLGFSVVPAIIVRRTHVVSVPCTTRFHAFRAALRS